MEYFTIALVTVGIMLLYAVPGYLSVKLKAIKAETIPAFAFVLMYVCQPCLTVSSLDAADYTKSLFLQMLGFCGVSLVLQALVLLAGYFAFRRKAEDVRYRVCNVAAAFGNCAFMGVPILNALFPDRPEAVLFSVAFLVGMNLLGWTVGSAIITRDKKYISLKKALFNPASLGLFVALPLFLTGTKLPAQLAEAVGLLGKMTTPLCMIIMGMRLATVRVRSLVCSPLQYLTVAFKQLIFPLLGLLSVWFLPFDGYVKETMFVLCCTPVASVVLNFAELLGEGQETAANMVLLGTVASVATIPVMTLLLAAL